MFRCRNAITLYFFFLKVEDHNVKIVRKVKTIRKTKKVEKTFGEVRYNGKKI